ncbi:hypothetical protein [Bordetella genomosp. 9]|uniref:hypothetical protein n=1 Tax=Bordetella genomosp. 9 TaxID=1416803 RepID=UPI0012FA0620|nr:hypothetical protein [Bordetella genomosp. 9]
MTEPVSLVAQSPGGVGRGGMAATLIHNAMHQNNSQPPVERGEKFFLHRTKSLAMIRTSDVETQSAR